jgi:hypothetical protein
LAEGKRRSSDAPPSAAQRRSSRIIAGVDAGVDAGAVQLHSILSPDQPPALILGLLPLENNYEEDSEESSVSTTDSASVFTMSDEESE